MFKSGNERKFWLLSLVTVIAIYISAFVSYPIAGFLRERGLIEITFFIGFILIISTILTFQFKKRPHWQEIAVWIGIISVYLMMFVRIEVPEERTHIIEYSILALFIFEACSERMKQEKVVWKPALYALTLTSLLGVIDECIQYMIPNRMFDIFDILFNIFAAFMAICSIIIIAWIKRKL